MYSTICWADHQGATTPGSSHASHPLRHHSKSIPCNSFPILAALLLSALLEKDVTARSLPGPAA